MRLSPRLVSATLVGLTASLGVVSCTDSADNAAQPTITTTVMVSEEAPVPEEAVVTEENTVTESAQETPAEQQQAPAASNVADCAPENFLGLGPSNPLVSHCDGHYARFGQPQTDWVLYAEAVDGRWQVIEGDGRLATGSDCYDQAITSRPDLPAEIVDLMAKCS